MTILKSQRAMRFLPFAALAAAVALSAPAMAEGTAPAAPSKWVKTCQADAATQKQSCTVMQRIVGPAGELVASVSVSQAAGDPNVQFIVSMPLGLNIKAGLAAQIDDQKPLPLKFAVCLLDGCYAPAKSNAALVNALKAGGKLTIVAKSRADKPIALPVTLTGFTKAYDGEGLDVAAAKTQFDQLAALAREDIAKARARQAETSPKTAAQ
jgi:invasion protein IalB